MTVYRRGGACDPESPPPGLLIRTFMPETVLLFLRILFAASLYAFLGWGFLSLWLDLQKEGAMLLGRKIPPILLQPDAGAAEILTFNRAQITIGRHASCDCVLDDDTVSSYHARLYYRHGQWWIEDLDSTNGTSLNHQPVDIPVVLTSRDRLDVGGMEFTVMIQER